MINKNNFEIKMYSKIVCFLILMVCFSSCNSDDNKVLETEEEEEETEEVVVIDDTDFEATDWTDATHSKNADPDFSEVFDDTAVKRLDI